MGDLDARAAAPKRTASARQIERLAQAHCRIAASAPMGDEIVFLGSSFVRFTLPHRNQLAHAFERRDGDRVITFMSPPSVGLPYGKWPRLLLIFLTTEAVRTRSRDIVLGASMSSFMKSLGVTVTGGANGSIRAFKDQLLRTASMFASLSQHTDEATRLQNLPMADEFTISWVIVGTDSRSGLPAKIRLGERIFEQMLKSAVPLDQRAVKAIQQSPMALDLYFWLTYRSHRPIRSSGAHIPWAGLREQFGSCYKDQSDFQSAFKSALRQVQLVYPTLRCEALESHFVLYRSPTSVAATAVRQAVKPC